MQLGSLLHHKVDRGGKKPPEEARFRFIQTYLQDEVTIGSVPTAISGIRALAMFLR